MLILILMPRYRDSHDIYAHREQKVLSYLSLEDETMAMFALVHKYPIEENARREQ